tara:strand:- start:41 stop:517 length:477 start_codon:yes stop_codon:yes gene_type:complete
MRARPQLMTIPILLEAKDTFFGPNERPSRHRRNVLRRMAFSNVFISRATTLDLGSVINRDHSTIVYYGKQHEWHSKHCKEYKDLYDAAIEVFKKYDMPKTDESEFSKLDNASLLNQLIQLKQALDNKNKIIKKQDRQLESLKDYYKKAEKAKKSFPTI